jgi:hypothetical protein
MSKERVHQVVRHLVFPMAVATRGVDVASVRAGR